MLDSGLVLKSGELFLTGQRETKASREDAAGLYFRDTRVLNRFKPTLHGEPLVLFDAHATDAAPGVVTMANDWMTIDGAELQAHQIVVEARVSLDTGLQSVFSLENFI